MATTIGHKMGRRHGLVVMFAVSCLSLLVCGCASVRLPPDFASVVRPQNAKLGLGVIGDDNSYDDEAIYLQRHIERNYPCIFYDCVLMDPDNPTAYYDVDVVVSGTITTSSEQVGRKKRPKFVFNFTMTHADTGESVPFEQTTDFVFASDPWSKMTRYDNGWDLIVYEICKRLSARKAASQ